MYEYDESVEQIIHRYSYLWFWGSIRFKRDFLELKSIFPQNQSAIIHRIEDCSASFSLSNANKSAERERGDTSIVVGLPFFSKPPLILIGDSVDPLRLW